LSEDRGNVDQVETIPRNNQKLDNFLAQPNRTSYLREDRGNVDQAGTNESRWGIRAFMKNELLERGSI